MDKKAEVDNNKLEMDVDMHMKTLDMVNVSSSQPQLNADLKYPELNLGPAKPVITDPLPIPTSGGRITPCSSPTMPSSPGGLHIPHFFHGGNIITKRTRSNSTYERAKDNPIERGTIKYFNRSKGHGFVTNEKGGDDVFVHVSDIEGELVPREGDQVTFRLCPIPPKLEKFQAIHVQIINFTPETHMRWDSPLRDEEKKENCLSHYEV